MEENQNKKWENLFAQMKENAWNLTIIASCVIMVGVLSYFVLKTHRLKKELSDQNFVIELLSEGFDLVDSIRNVQQVKLNAWSIDSVSKWQGKLEWSESMRDILQTQVNSANNIATIWEEEAASAKKEAIIRGNMANMYQERWYESRIQINNLEQKNIELQVLLDNAETERDSIRDDYKDAISILKQNNEVIEPTIFGKKEKLIAKLVGIGGITLPNLDGTEQNYYRLFWKEKGKRKLVRK